MFFTLLKTRLAYMFSGIAKRTKKNKAAGVGMIVLAVFLLLYLAGAVFGISFAIFFATCRPLCESGNTDAYFAIAALLSFLLGFISSVTAAKTQVFESGDNDLLLAMPIHHRDIILSRLASLLVVEYASQLLVAVPCAVVYLIFYGLSPVTSAFFILGFALLPLMTLTASCFVGWLVSLITSRLGKLKSIFSILLYVVFFGGYMLIYINVFSADFDETIENLAGVLAPMADGLRTFAPPMVWFGKGVSGSSLYFLLFAAAAVIPALIMLWLMSRTFVSMASRGKRTSKGKYTSADAKVSGLCKTLLSKELSRVFSSSGYLLNSTAGMLLTVVAAVFAVAKADALREFMTIDPVLTRLAPAIVAAIAVLMASMNTMSSTSISIEGKTLWILKSLPVRGSDVLFSKILAHTVMCTPALVAAVVLICVIMGMRPLHIALMILLSLTASVLFAAFGLTINLLMPRFDWVNETAAAKQGGSTVVSMFGGMFIAFILAAAAIVPSLFLDAAVGIIIATIISAGAASLFCLYLMRSGGKRFDRLNADS